MNISYRRVGGVRFLKIGRFSFTFCVSRTYRPIKGPALWHIYRRFYG